jgi:hypothetical protein
MKQDTDSRRAFLQKFGALAASVTIVPIVAAGCGGGTKTEGTAAAPAAKAIDCNDTSMLTETDKTLRTTLQYVTQSPDPAKLCSNCQFYTAVTSSPKCGGCTILKGPIAADGWCSSWAAKPA